MQTQGVFAAIGDQYFFAAKNVWYFWRKTKWLKMALLLPLALLYSTLLILIWGLFSMLFTLDFLSSLVDSLRHAVLEKLRKWQHGIGQSWQHFLLFPVYICLLAPVFLLCAILPKVSSEIGVAADGAMSEVGEGGIFLQMNQICWESSKNLFAFVSQSHLLLKPFFAVIALTYSMFLMLIGACFYLLIILDVLSVQIEKMRRFFVGYTRSLSSNVKGSTRQFLLLPPALCLLAPVMLLALLIPKISSAIDIR